MANYDYICTKCQHVQEEQHLMKETPKIKCEKCGAKSEKVSFYKTQFSMNTHPGSHIDEADNFL